MENRMNLEPTNEEYKEAIRIVSEWVETGYRREDRVCKVNAEILGALNRLYLCVTQHDGVAWSDTFPQEEGLYWFFGQDFGPKHEIIRLHTVKVNRVRNGYMYVCDGHFIYPSEAVGVWLPMTLPEFPRG
jgi:hypothetical protein